MRISVLIPTFNRAASLLRCFRALSAQSRMPDELILVVRDEDEQTLKCVSAWVEKLPLKVVLIDRPGHVQALNAGLEKVTGEIVAITDDDTAPRSDWLARIESIIAANPNVGGVGGRDWYYEGEEIVSGTRRTVGKILFFGRIVGNHHLGTKPAREVHILKGANMSFRRSAIEGMAFDERLRGGGAQVANDLAFSLAVRRRGWKLIYDPGVAVDHFSAPRHLGAKRGERSIQAAESAAFNIYLALLSFAPGPIQRSVACMWQVCVGTRYAPGWAHLFRGFLRGDNLFPTWKAAVRARRDARKTHKIAQA